MFIYRNIDGDDSGVFPTGSPDGQLEHHEDDDTSGVTIQDVRKAVVSTGAADDDTENEANGGPLTDSGEDTRASCPSIPCIIDPDGLKSVPPPIVADGKLIKPEQLNLSFIEPDTAAEPDSVTNGVVSDDGAVNVKDPIISGITPERDAFSNIRFVGDSTPLTKEQIEERQMRMRIETAFGSETPETRMLLKRVRHLLGAGDDVKALQILEEELQFVARLRYDQEHRQKTHEFSEATDKDPTGFATFFIREASIGRTSNVLDLGCGFMGSSIAFAKNGARVTAIDASSYAIESGNKFISGQQYADRITTLNDDFIEFLYSAAPGSFTHIHSCSSLHYRPSMILMRDLRRAYTILSPNDGYLCMAMKTNESESKSKQVPLTMDRYHCGVDPRDKMFRIYPEKLAIDSMVRGAGFTILEAFTSRINGYDVKNEVEVFRVLLAQANANKERSKIIR